MTKKEHTYLQGDEVKLITDKLLNDFGLYRGDILTIKDTCGHSREGEPLYSVYQSLITVKESEIKLIKE